MILAGGRVDELNVLTHYRPKSAVPFGGFARIIDFPLSNLMHSGLEKVAILSQFRSYSLINHIGVGAAWDMIGRNRGVSILPPSTSHANSSWYKGSADSVYQNLDFIQYHDPETLLIISGDHVYNMDYREIIAYHREKDADFTLCALKIPPNTGHRFGLAEIDDEDGERGGRIHKYEEKPRKPRYRWASMTIFCCKPQALYQILEANAREDDSFEFGRDIIPRFLAAGLRVYGFKFKGYWGYTRTIEEYWRTNMDLLGDEPPIDFARWGIRTNLEHRGVRDLQPLLVGRDAVLADSMVYNGCHIEGVVEHSIIFPGCRVGKGAVVRDSVLSFNNEVGEGAVLEKVVSDVNVSFGAGSRVGEAGPCREKAATVVGWNNHIPEGSIIASDCTIFPGLGADKFARPVKPGEVVR